MLISAPTETGTVRSRRPVSGNKGVFMALPAAQHVFVCGFFRHTTPVPSLSPVSALRP